MIQFYIKTLLVFCSLLLPHYACVYRNQNITILSFKNDSNITVDSVVFIIHNYIHKISNVPPKTHIRENVHLDSLRLNTHSLTIIAKLYIKDTVFRGAVSYDDLYVDLKKEYKLILKEDLSTKIVPLN